MNVPAYHAVADTSSASGCTVLFLAGMLSAVGLVTVGALIADAPLRHPRARRQLGGPLDVDSSLSSPPSPSSPPPPPRVRRDTSASDQRQLAYRASAVELEWTASPVAITTQGICTVANRPSQTSAITPWLTYVESSRSPERLREPTANESGVLSRFIGRNGCEEYIEPLTGVARHPLSSNMGCRWYWRPDPKRATNFQVPERGMPGKYNLGYLLVHSECGGERSTCARYHRRPPSTDRRFLYYDLGCSDYGKPMTQANALGQGSAYANSLQHFLAIYGQSCITFDGIWGWEGVRFDPVSWWRNVPAEVVHKLRFYNTPLLNTSDFFSVLNRTARPDDFVAVKLDIDEPPLEMALINALLEDPALAALVDELFFEYHFHWEGGAHAKGPGPWGWTQSTNTTRRNYLPDSVDDALAVMRRLREVGIRAHFWI